MRIGGVETSRDIARHLLLTRPSRTPPPPYRAGRPRRQEAAGQRRQRRRRQRPPPQALVGMKNAGKNAIGNLMPPIDVVDEPVRAPAS